MKPNLKLFLLVLLSAFGISASQAQNAPTAFSLQQAIDYALENKPTIHNARIQEKIAKAKVGEIRSMGLPQANIGVDFIDNIVVQSVFLPANTFDQQAPADQTAELKFGTQYNGSANFTVNQLIFDGSYLIGLKAADTYVQLSQKATTQTRIEVTQQVTKAYYTALVNQERMALLDKNLLRLDTLLYQTKQMNKQGFVELLDVDRLQVSYNNLKVEKQKADRLQALSINLLKFQMGLPQTKQIALTDKLGEVEVDAAKINSPDFRYENRIEYSMLQTQRDLALLDMRNQKSGYLPKLYGFYRFGYNKGAVTFSNLATFDETWGKSASLGLQLSIPVFDGLRKHYQVQQSKLTQESLKTGFQSLEQSFDLQVSQSSAFLENSLAVLESQKQNLALAEKVANVSRIKYQEGVGSNLEIITAETDLREAQTNYYTALFDVLIAKVDLDVATGTFK